MQRISEGKDPELLVPIGLRGLVDLRLLQG